ncbi:MAG: YkvA family protein [Myxococcales bacterium]
MSDSIPEDLGKRDLSEAEREAKAELIHHVEERFSDKIRRIIGKVPFALDAVAMYYAMVDPKTPFWVKATAATALAYLISPLDAIPDFIPIAGYTDDASVIYAALTVLHGHIRDDHMDRAKRFLKHPDAELPTPDV